MGWSYRHLTLLDRTLIETQLGLGLRPAAIAAGLERARSTITREIARNGWRGLRRSNPGRVEGQYRAIAADGKACLLASRPRVVRRLRPGEPLWELVLGQLRQGLSPEQIERTLARMPAPVRLSHETIYTSLYAMPRGELRASLLELLRHGHKARRKRRGSRERRNQAIPEMVLIDQRPLEVEMRLVPGHWEGDLIIGKSNRSQVGTLVERTTLFVALVQLDNARADTAATAFAAILNRFDSQLRRSLTYDQGTEMAQHRSLTARTGVDVYFAHPRAPWERGIMENTNGLLRQYLPRGTDLSRFSQDQLDDIAWKLNTRPRKTLGWKCPAELFLPDGAFDFVQHWSAKIIPVALGP
jgi:IS30 family transposase